MAWIRYGIKELRTLTGLTATSAIGWISRADVLCERIRLLVEPDILHAARSSTRSACAWLRHPRVIARQLANDDVRPIIFRPPRRHLPAALCQGPDDHGVNSIFNS